MSKEIECCPNAKCAGKLEFCEWADGSKKNLQPRRLHCTHHIILLVGAIYTCSEVNHRVFSTDPRLLNKLGSYNLPFCLLHRSGLTCEFVNSIVSLAREGLSIKAIARHMQRLREECSAQIIRILVQSYKHFLGKEFTTDEITLFTVSDSLTSIIKPFPNNDIIARCIIIHFQHYERAYLSEMASIKIQRCIRLDHTFKVASNIGYLRSDGKWVTLYKTLFIVLNEEGVVVAWQFTKSTSLEEVKPLLLDLKERIDLPEHMSLTVYVDNCCQVRRQIQEIFGNAVLVKLDIFHAVQRISRAMSKQHTMFLSCIHDFKMTLRNPVDLGKRRTMHTPTSDAIIRNIERFMNTWSSITHIDKNIITPKVAKQVHLLQAHINHGCLSNIEPGGGTNYNEALHRFINPHFLHAGRIGLPLAYALLTILFYVYNYKKQSKNTLLDTVSLKLGLYTSDTPPKFGVMPKDIDASALMNESGNNKTDLLADTQQMLSLPDEHIERILKNALSSTEMIQNIHRIPGSYGTLSYRLIPFMSSVPSLFFRGSHSCKTSTENDHECRLSAVLKAWNMCRQKVEGDGNCCFSAVAFSITVNWDAFTEEEREVLLSHGLSSSMNLTLMADHLRKLAVDEWLENPLYYQSFLVDSVQVEQEARKFLLPGYFYGDLADTMVLSIANAINTTIIVFSSIQCQPVIVVTPRSLKTKLPLMLAFTQFGAGHYDAIMPLVENTSISKTSCTCGRDDKTEQVHCQERLQKYTTIIRCKCLLNKSSCSDRCKCKNCGNPCGKKEVINSLKKRKRFRHEWQNYTHENSAQFAKNRRESITTGPFSITEYFVLINILDVGEENGLDMDSSTILNIYNQVLAISTGDLHPRNKQDIDSTCTKKTSPSFHIYATINCNSILRK